MGCLNRNKSFPWEMYHQTVLPATHINLDATVHAKSHRLALLLRNHFALIHCSLRLATSSIMFGEADQTSNVASDIPAAGAKTLLKRRARLHLQLHPPPWLIRRWQEKKSYHYTSTGEHQR
jgi:hypothetical protein